MCLDVVIWYPLSVAVFVERLHKILHCVYLAMRGKNVRVSRWFRQARQPILTACGGMAKSARCCLPRPPTSFCQTYDGTMRSKLPRHHCLCLRTLRKSALFFPSCAPVCPRGSLLDVSRLLGRTLRPSAPVCCCHQDSLTRWRLAFAQEAARVASASSSHLLL